MNKDTGYGDWWGAELRVTKPLWGQHRFTVGAEYRDNFRQVQRNYDEAPFVSYLDDPRDSRTWGLYAQQEIVVRPDVLLNLGVRYDY